MSRPPPASPLRPRRRWRFYRTPGGREPVRDFLYGAKLSDSDAAAIAVAMREVRGLGREHPDVYHLRGDIWQIEIDGERVIFRLLFRGGRPLWAGSPRARDHQQEVAEGSGAEHSAGRKAVIRLASARPTMTVCCGISSKICMMSSCQGEMASTNSSPDGRR